MPGKAGNGLEAHGRAAPDSCQTPSSVVFRIALEWPPPNRCRSMGASAPTGHLGALLRGTLSCS
eukprot:10366047-Alexandrium_andersonii.AAC.1